MVPMCIKQSLTEHDPKLSIYCWSESRSIQVLCTICQRQIACEHQGKRHVERHSDKTMHQENAKSLKAQITLKIHSESSALAEKVSLVVQLL